MVYYNKYIRVNLSATEKAKVEKLAKEANKGVSRYVRDLLVQTT